MGIQKDLFFKENNQPWVNLGRNKKFLGRLDTKTKRGDPKNKKNCEKSCNCNNWRLPGGHRSLNNLSFETTYYFGGITLLDFFKTSGFLECKIYEL